jgi:hypothetical protein
MSVVEERWLHPDYRGLLLFLVIVIGLLAALIVPVDIYDYFFLPAYSIIYKPPSVWLSERAKAVAMMCVVCLIGWLVERRKAWLVSQDGIAMYRFGRQTRLLHWSELRGVNVKPLRIEIVATSRPHVESLFAVAPRLATWFEQMAKERLADHTRRPSSPDT